MLTHVGIHEGKEEARIEELSYKYTIRNRGKSFAVGVFADPSNCFDDNCFEDCVENDNDKSLSRLTVQQIKDINIIYGTTIQSAGYDIIASID